jgi:hypothetical protein
VEAVHGDVALEVAAVAEAQVLHRRQRVVRDVHLCKKVIKPFT